jgi:pyruvate dehydrogenase E1 component alpha subunit
MDRDPIKLHSEWLLEHKLTDRATLDQIYAEVKLEMEKAVQFAIAAPYPNVDKVEQDVYA